MAKHNGEVLYPGQKWLYCVSYPYLAVGKFLDAAQGYETLEYSTQDWEGITCHGSTIVKGHQTARQGR